MEEKLKTRGYTQKDTAWVKGNFTVRWDLEKIEAFDNSRYYSAPLDKIDIETLLNEIDELLLSYHN